MTLLTIPNPHFSVKQELSSSFSFQPAGRSVESIDSSLVVYVPAAARGMQAAEPPPGLIPGAMAAALPPSILQPLLPPQSHLSLMLGDLHPAPTPPLMEAPDMVRTYPLPPALSSPVRPCVAVSHRHPTPQLITTSHANRLSWSPRARSCWTTTTCGAGRWMRMTGSRCRRRRRRLRSMGWGGSTNSRSSCSRKRRWPGNPCRQYPRMCRIR